MSGLHRYTVHGLEVASEIELPELRPSPDPTVAVEVLVRRCSVKPLAEDPDGRWFYVRTDRTAIVRIRGVATFAVRDGINIDVDVANHADADTVRVYLLGSALGVLLHQRGDLPLHLSAVVVDGRAWAFTAPSGTGKSTLAAALHLHSGLPFVTDDVGVARPAPHGDVDGGLWLWPGPTVAKLRADAHAGVADVARSDGPEHRGADKVQLSVRHGAVTGPVPLAAILLLERTRPASRSARSSVPRRGSDGEAGASALQVRPVSGAEAFLAAQATVYRLPHGAAATSVPTIFDRVALLASTIPFAVGQLSESDCPASSERAEGVLRILRVLDRELARAPVHSEAAARLT